ncbi:uncharacterized protein [Notamacropus eugenii]|uniref:uncharacterized protein isoform X2 n=1 Tax=Notamacropus eugenii TaxID=9315 RepID=UPI003B66CD19
MGAPGCPGQSGAVQSGLCVCGCANGGPWTSRGEGGCPVRALCLWVSQWGPLDVQGRHWGCLVRALCLWVCQWGPLDVQGRHWGCPVQALRLWVSGCFCPRVTMTTSKPKRMKFSEEEKFVILEEFSLRKDVLVPKTGRYRNTSERQRAWQEIAAAVNALSPLVQRTPDEVRKKWKNMILDARKELAAAKHPLLLRRPRERLSHDIFALLNKTGPEPPESLDATGPGFRTRGPAGPSGPACKAEGLLDPVPSSVLRPQGGGIEPSQDREGLCHIEVGRKLDSWPEVPGKSLLPPTMGVQARFKEDTLTGDASEYGEKRLLDPLKDLPLHCEAVPQVHPATVGGALSPDGPAGDMPHLCGMPVPASPSPDSALTYKIKCPVSPLLDWPCLGVSTSPITPSGRLDALSTEGIPTALHNNAKQDIPSSFNRCFPEADPRRFWIQAAPSEFFSFSVPFLNRSAQSRAWPSDEGCHSRDNHFPVPGSPSSLQQPKTE